MEKILLLTPLVVGDDYRLNGGAGNDTLDGGAGNDTLIGGAGNDTYVVDSTLDVITEGSNAGTDTVNTALSSYSLATLVNVENLTYTGITASTLTGNTTTNTLTGGAGNDTLDGGAGNDVLIGGIGKDSLAGGLGSDVFYFKTYAELGLGVNADVISDFSKVQGDKLDLSLLDAKLGTAFNDLFNFLNAAPTTAANANGVLWYSNGILYGSNDTDVAAEFQIYVDLTGITAANASTYIVL